MNGGDWLTLVIIGFLIVVAGIFAAAETSFSRLTRVHALHLEEQGKRFAKFAAAITEDPPRYINPVLLATLTCHVLGSTLAATLAIRIFHDAGEWIATIAMTTVLFVFAEAAPKTSALQHTDSWVLPLAPIVYGLGRALYPLTRALIGLANVIMPGKGLKRGPFMSEGEIRHIVDVAEKESVIEEEEREMIHSIFELGDTRVREVMVPRPDMIVVEVNTTVQAAADVAIRNGYSRIPVYENEPDNIVGVVYAKDLFRALRRGEERERPLRELMREAYFVPESMPVSDLLKEMQKRKVHMAIVADEYGDVAGLVTLEDLLEEIVGEITDEYDVEESMVVKVREDAWRVQGKVPIWEFNETVGSEIPQEEEYTSVGGLVATALGKMPEPGDEVTYDGFRFRVERVNQRRIASILVERVTPPATGNGE